ncbi:hypothetical protein [Streptococcus sobrinus]|uniref:hypothetical protein n=1 Tax=Streptococcus sobrinus TaxID=1310 RepID=UPI0002E5E094|nr:hypothetical protein [Streptococcus sobrinus]
MFTEFHNLFQPLSKLIEKQQDIITKQMGFFYLGLLLLFLILVEYIICRLVEEFTLILVNDWFAITVPVGLLISSGVLFMCAVIEIPYVNEARTQIEYLQKQPKSTEKRLTNYLKTHDVTVEEKTVSSLKGKEDTDYKFLWFGSNKSVDLYINKAEKLEQITITPKDSHSSKLLTFFVVYKSDTKVILRSEDGDVAISLKEYQELVEK